MEQPILDGQVVWRPDASRARETNLARFMARLGISRADTEGYAELLRGADADPERFWNSLVHNNDIRFYEPYEAVLDTSGGIEWAKWCVGGTTNLALNCLDKHRDSPTWSKPAVVWEGEDGARCEWTYRDLDVETSRLASALRLLGFGPGDVIGLYMPMVPEAAAALLAVAKIGAILLPLFSGFGASAISARLNDGGATGVITCEGTLRRGKRVPMKPILDEALADSLTVRHVLVCGNQGGEADMTAGRDLWWHEACAGMQEDAPTEVMTADAPVFLVYTSGTSGKPKGTVHSHCGFAMKMALDMALCNDFRAGDRVMWMSDMGWVVGPMLIVGATMAGATIVIAEGAPDYPDKGRYWRLIQDLGVTILGMAPTIIRSFMQQGGAGVDDFDLNRLRLTISTGEAWTPDAWNWMFEHVCRRRIPILNYSGGSEVGGGILTGTMLHPLKPCAFGGPVPGVGADIVDDEGRSIPVPGQGELVLRKPSAGLTRGLWHDPVRYIESYWSQVPGLWWHGDRAARDADGFWFILGRSDDTLKIAGKRTGPSEIEALVMSTGKVAEVAAIGVPDDIKGEAVVLVASPLHEDLLEDEITGHLSAAVVSGLGTPFKPRAVLLVPELPKTRNMKIMRRVVRAAVLGRPAGDLSSLVNPEAIEKIALRALDAGMRA